MWTKSENGEPVRPQAVEIAGDFVILRKDIEMVEADGDMPAHYAYEEWQMTKEQYEIYKNFEEVISDQDDALVELAELISEVL